MYKLGKIPVVLIGAIAFVGHGINCDVVESKFPDFFLSHSAERARVNLVAPIPEPEDLEESWPIPLYVKDCKSSGANLKALQICGPAQQEGIEAAPATTPHIGTFLHCLG